MKRMGKIGNTISKDTNIFYIIRFIVRTYKQIHQNKYRHVNINQHFATH